MKACVIHAAEDVRLDARDEAPLGPGEVRLSFAYGGVCGSDIHYAAHGRVGDSVVRDPMILGHEFSATVAETYADVTGLAPGTKVAVNPALPCGACIYCREGRSNLCADMRFMGSAARRPHQAGGFAERPVVMASQCVPLPDAADLRHVALAEPYAVALHAVALAGNISGQVVLITGAGVIGQLLAVAARRAGASEIVMADVVPEALDRAQALGADRVLNSGDSSAVAKFLSETQIHVAFEASGAPQAFNLCTEALRPGGALLQVGFLPAAAPLTMAKLLTRELRVLGTYRFVDEFDEAVRQIVAEEVDLRPVISADMMLDDPGEVFRTAQDKVNTLKVMVHFG
ncbi:L-idonate 5-dehydrogenase [Roseovarius sp. MMSF_3281]|uniref:L-idonate 5-dehydrogenase n=1 Tax=Roseovarius sp. MMSF_3281 TaxID=3046694 RepID=UPI00273FD02F|nr:L-idonate 5-dehydrogenase [Roseovarius sp. MMSF_3281]